MRCLELQLEDVLNVISSGFLRGGAGGFLKGTGEMIKGPAATSRDVRVGVTMVTVGLEKLFQLTLVGVLLRECVNRVLETAQSYVVLVHELGAGWLDRHLAQLVQHVLELAAQPRAAPTHVDAVYSRQCVSFVLRQLLGGRLLGEKQQVNPSIDC